MELFSPIAFSRPLLSIPPRSSASSHSHSLAGKTDRIPRGWDWPSHSSGRNSRGYYEVKPGGRRGSDQGHGHHQRVGDRIF
eukprot:766354-Hanusia_phi.AAC.2